MRAELARYYRWRFMEEKKQWEELANLLDAILDGRVGLTEGCRAVVSSGYPLERNNPLFNPFRGFDSESDAFPLGEVRNEWASDSLRKIDAEREQTEAYYRNWVFEAAKQLRSYAREVLMRAPQC